MSFQHDQARLIGFLLIALGIVALFKLWWLVPIALLVGGGIAIYRRQRDLDGPAIQTWHAAPPGGQTGWIAPPGQLIEHPAADQPHDPQPHRAAEPVHALMRVE